MNVVESMRQKSVIGLFKMPVFNKSFLAWRPAIEKYLGKQVIFRNILDLSDKLSTIFKTTGSDVRSQSSVSAGGSTWEGLVCWYLNLALIGSRTVVIKQSKHLVPPSISDAITVNYGSFASNTESDLISITFPEQAEFLGDATAFSDLPETDYLNHIDNLCQKYFSFLEVGIVQCKTNWNDNAQIPMLWHIVYSASGFKNGNITLGRNSFSIRQFANFFYAFVTVPSGKRQVYTSSDVLPVMRVHNLSGGNYWGRPSVSGVASSLKEFFNRNLSSSWILKTHERDVDGALKHKQDFSYFNISL